MKKNLLEKIEHDLTDYYCKKRDLSDAAQHVGWKSQWAQEIRFSQLLKVIDFTNGHFSINDLGCGKGALATFLQALDNVSFTYNGYDILDSMISEAKKESKLSNANFFKLTNTSDMLQADYTLASGIFNLKYNAQGDDWLDYIKSTVDVMWKKSDKGIAFNCLTNRSDKTHRSSELYYADPGEMIQFCSKFTRHFALLHNYQEYDFTVLMWKK